MEASDFTQADQVRDLISELKETCRGREFSDVVDDEGHECGTRL